MATNEANVSGVQLARVLGSRIRAGVSRSDQPLPGWIWSATREQREQLARWISDVEDALTARNRVYFEALSVPCFGCRAPAGQDCRQDYGCTDESRAVGRRVAVV